MSLIMKCDLELKVDFVKPATQSEFTGTNTEAAQKLRDSVNADLDKALTYPDSNVSVTITYLHPTGTAGHSNYQLTPRNGETSSLRNTELSMDGGDSDKFYHTFAYMGELAFNDEEQEVGFFSGSVGDINANVFIEAMGAENDK